MSERRRQMMNQCISENKSLASIFPNEFSKSHPGNYVFDGTITTKNMSVTNPIFYIYKTGTRNRWELDLVVPLDKDGYYYYDIPSNSIKLMSVDYQYYNLVSETVIGYVRLVVQNSYGITINYIGDYPDEPDNIIGRIVEH